MEAIEYLKLATDKTEAGDLIKENKLTETVVKLMSNYAEFRVKNCSIPDVIELFCTCGNSEKEKDSLIPVYCNNCNAYVQTVL